MFTLTTYRRLISAAKRASTAHDKGLAFEALCKYLLEALDGVEVKHQRVKTKLEEIDLIVWNAGSEEVLRPWEAVIFVECKNWSKPAGKDQIESFLGKLRRKKLKTGIFIAAKGVTGSFSRNSHGDVGAAGLIINALQDEVRVIVLTMSDMEMIRAVDDLREMIKMRYCGLFANKVL